MPYNFRNLVFEFVVISFVVLFVLAAITMPVTNQENMAQAANSSSGGYVKKTVRIGFAEVEVEGRTGDYVFTGIYDGFARGTGVKASVRVTPNQTSVTGDVFMCGRVIYSGPLDFQSWGFSIPYSITSGRAGCEMTIRYKPSGVICGRVIGWRTSAEGKQWVKLGFPYGKPTGQFNTGLDPSGEFTNYFWKIKIRINIPGREIVWMWG